MARKRSKTASTRNMVLVLGDQLDDGSAAFDDFDRKVDRVWMVESPEEAEHAWSTKPRAVMFLSAMRHFRSHLRRRHIEVVYRELDDRKNRGSFSAELEQAVRRHPPKKLIVVQPGEHRVLKTLRKAARELGVKLEVRPDRSFLSTPGEFAAHVEGRKQLRQEYFYRELRRRLGVLMNGRKPSGGTWNTDAQNRRSFGRQGPPGETEPKSFPPDSVTRDVIKTVNRVLGDHPGRLSGFDFPVTPEQAAEALEDFIEHRLPLFGVFQDAMWTDRPFLYHSRLSAAMNLKLLDPRDAVRAAEAAYRAGRVPLNSAEGFIRQIVGWREYVHGVYWHFMPEYLKRNALKADAELPALYWTGATDAFCLQQAVGQTLSLGYAHHIQRLMVTGLYALLLGVRPQEVHKWYLGVYVDAVEWVELPNTLGMSQFADGGVMASKPYAAGGNYIDRMSNYCHHCRFDPSQTTGEEACPFATLYWDFLMRNKAALRKIPRMILQLRNLSRLGRSEQTAIRKQARMLRSAEMGR
jgi:deoxyribodipyrimidine photolyase-related protein